MGLSLIVGPAHSGKVARLLAKFRNALATGADPWLIVPRRADVEPMQRELATGGALIGGWVSRFDDLFEYLAGPSPDGRREIGDAERQTIVRRLEAAAEPTDSLRLPGIVDAVLEALRELDGAALDPDDLGVLLGDAVRRYRAELDRLGLEDQGDMRRRGLERLRSVLEAWDGRPVLAHGFEDLTALQLGLIEALAGRGEVTVTLPYEPGRAAYASLERTASDLARLAGGDGIEELPAGAHAHLPPEVAHIERSLFVDVPERAPLGDALGFVEGAGERGVADLVAEEALALIRAGTPAERIGVIAASVEASRSTLEAACAALGVPLAIEARRPLRATPFGQSLLAVLRFAWVGAERPALFAHLRSPFSGVGRAEVDRVEGMLRGNAVRSHDRTIEMARERSRSWPFPTLEAALVSGRPVEVVRALAADMLRHAHGLGAHPTGNGAVPDLRAFQTVESVLAGLERLEETGEPLSRAEVLDALDHARIAGDRPGVRGRVALLDLEGARTRTFDAVIVLGLEQGTLPRAGRLTPLLDDDLRSKLDDERGARLRRPDQASRDRYLFLTACTRARTRLVLVRQAATDDGVARDPGPFWEATRELFDDEAVRRATRRRPLSNITREIASAPTERERLRALVALSVNEPASARALARANGWDRRLDRAVAAFSRATAITQPAALGVFGAREAWSVSALDRMVTCSSAWFVERWLNPGQIDRRLDRLVRGNVMHGTLQRLYQALPSAIPGAERVTPENLDDVLRLLEDCLGQAIAANVVPDIDAFERRELEESLRRDLERYLRAEAVSESTFIPRKLEHGFRSHALAPGVVVSGKIDRVDIDPMSARGVVVDYKSGKAPGAAEIERDSLLQVPLYLLHLRDVLGLEPMGGLYVAVGAGQPRGLLRDGAERVEGLSRNDYLDPEQFDEAIESARSTAVELVGRIREGDVRHDPHGGTCPDWCDLWRICRKARG